MFSGFPSPTPCATPLKPQDHALLAGFTRSHHTLRIPSTMRTDMTTEERGQSPCPAPPDAGTLKKSLQPDVMGCSASPPAIDCPQHFSAAPSIFRDRAEKLGLAIQASATSDVGPVMRG